MSKVGSIELQAFRGVRDEQLELAGASLFLYGENGTGKSSIIDSLEFFFTGAVTHLESAQSLSTKRHAPHIALGSAALRVSLSLVGFDGTYSRTLKDAPVPFKGLAPTFERIAGSRFILRRQQLLDFILQQAAPRYQQLATLIGVEELDRIELTWKAAVDEVDLHWQTVVSRTQEERNKLQQELGDLAKYDHETVLSALNSKLALLGQLPLASLDEIEARKLGVFQAGNQRERATLASQLEGLRDVSDQIVSSIASLATHEELWNDVAELKAEAEQLREIRFRGLLMQARDLVSEHGMSTCPVCAQPIEAVDLVAELGRRIMASDALGARVDRVDAAKRRLAAALASLRSLMSRLREGAAKQESLGTVVEASVAADTWCRDVSTQLTVQLHELELGPFADFIDSEVVKTLDAACAGLHKTLSERIAALAQTEDEKRGVALMTLLTRVWDAYSSMGTASNELVGALKERQVLKKVYDAFVETKKERVQAIYSELEADIGRFYEAIHPKELQGDVKLEVVATKRGSAEIKMGFAEKAEVDPRAYNSEAHLDSLGLCIFLAFAKRFNVDVPILALDDVVSSVDAAHRGRVCQLIFSEFPKYQLFITTHDELWFEQLLAAQRAAGFQPVKALRIQTWTLDDGPRFAEHRPRWKVLAQKIKDGDKQGAASLARKSLEWVLFELAVGLEVQVALRRDGRYDVGSLFDPTLARARKLITDFDANHDSVLANLKRNVIFGNLLTHNNPFAENASINDVSAFVDAVRALHDVFWCDECGRFARYFRDAKMIKCQCASGGKEWRTKG